MRFLHKLRSLRPPGRRMLLRATCLLPVIAVGIRVFGFTRVYNTANRLASRSRLPGVENEGEWMHRARHIVWYLRHYGPYRGNCLSRSVLLWWLLRRLRIESDLRIGVRHDEGDFQAHAWVEYHGHPLNAEARVGELFTAFSEAIVPQGTRFV